MKIAIMIATFSLLAIGGLAAEGVAETTIGTSILTQNAAAACIEDGVTGTCHTACVYPPRPLDWACPM